MAHAIQLNQDAGTISKRLRGIFRFHLATMLTGKVILAALIFANAQIDSRSFEHYAGWPCKSFRFYNYGLGTPTQYGVAREALAVNILVCLTVLLVPVAWVEWRCRNGRIADVRQFLARIHWGAKLGAATTGIALVCLNLVVMEQHDRTSFIDCGWPFTFSFIIFPPDTYGQFFWYPYISGIRDLILNLYFAAFASLLTLLFVQHFVTRFSRNKKDHP